MRAQSSSVDAVCNRAHCRVLGHAEAPDFNESFELLMLPVNWSCLAALQWACAAFLPARR